MEGFTGNQLVFHNEGGVVKAGGYIINSKILQSGGSAIKNLNVSNGNGVVRLGHSTSESTMVLQEIQG